MSPAELALLAACLLAALEVVTTTFILLGFALGCLAVSAAEFLTGRASLDRDALLFAAVSTVAILVLRLTFARPGDTRHEKGDINDF